MTKIPKGYRSSLSLYDTQKAIEQVKNVFLTKLCAALKLSRVTAPLIVDPLTGMNDNLNGVEHPVAFDLPNVGKNAEVVQSLAKWKRYALWRYNFAVGRGLVCDMNAIRRDEQTSAILIRWKTPSAALLRQSAAHSMSSSGTIRNSMPSSAVRSPL